MTTCENMRRVWDENEIRWAKCSNPALVLVFLRTDEGQDQRLFVCQSCYEKMINSEGYVGARIMSSQEKSCNGNNDDFNYPEPIL